MPKRTALLVCNSPRRRGGRRKKTRPRRTQRMALRCFEPNFPYKYNSTAPQNCQVRLKIHKSVTFPSYTGNEPVFSALRAAQSAFQIRPFSRPSAERFKRKYYLRYFVKFPAFRGVFCAVFGVFFGDSREHVRVCKYDLPSANDLLACATIPSPTNLWAMCTILRPKFLHLYKITKSRFLANFLREIRRFS